MKKNLYILLVLLIICLGVVCYAFFKPVTYSNGSATISQNDGQKAYVIIDNQKRKNISINTTIFDKNDKVNIKYYKKLGKYYISEINYKISTVEDKKEIVQKIYKNEDLKKYREMIEVRRKNLENGAAIYNENAINEYVSVIPLEIDNQKFNIIDVRDYMEYFFVLYLKMGTEKNAKVTLTLKEDLEVLSLESAELKNINDIGELKKIDYEKKENIITFDSLGFSTYYVAKIKLTNGNILNYIFQ